MLVCIILSSQRAELSKGSLKLSQTSGEGTPPSAWNQVLLLYQMYVPKKKKMNGSCGLTIRFRLVNRRLERVLETIQIWLKVSVYNDITRLEDVEVGTVMESKSIIHT